MATPIEPDRYANTGFSVKDTAPEINEMIWSSISTELPPAERRRQFYRRLYGEELPDAVANRTAQA
jgi:hypothetical protein